MRWLFQSCPEGLPALAARSDLGAKLDGEIWQGVLENLEQRRAWVPAGEIVGTMLRRGAIPETAFGWLLDLVENDPGLISWNMIDAGIGGVHDCGRKDNGMVRQKAILILGGLQAPPSAAVSRESERRTQA